MKRSYLKSRATPRKLPKSSITKLKKKADAFFSLATRIRFANPDGTNTCVTCGVVKPMKLMQCGHFMSRRFSATRFSEINTAPQCVGCNMFKNGEQYKFSQFIDEFYGEGTARQIQKEAQQFHNFTIEELEQVISDSKEYIRNYESNTGN